MLRKELIKAIKLMTNTLEELCPEAGKCPIHLLDKMDGGDLLIAMQLTKETYESLLGESAEYIFDE